MFCIHWHDSKYELIFVKYSDKFIYNYLVDFSAPVVVVVYCMSLALANCQYYYTHERTSRQIALLICM